MGYQGGRMLDFTRSEGTLFTGKRNGQLRCQDHKIHGAGYTVFAKQGQLITSSYFLGAFELEFKKFNNVQEVREAFTLNCSQVTKDEFFRAVKRVLPL